MTMTARRASQAAVRKMLDETDYRYAEWAAERGYRPSQATECIYRVAAAGKVHKHGYCDCRNRYRVFDHLRMWRNKDNRYVLTSEPYGAFGDELATFITDCQALDLDVHVSAVSPYYPGYTLMIEVTRSA